MARNLEDAMVMIAELYYDKRMAVNRIEQLLIENTDQAQRIAELEFQLENKRAKKKGGNNGS